MKYISAFAVGALFAIGLGLAGMLQPENIQGFLDFTGDWKPTLSFVMAGAAAVYFVAFHLLRGEKPLLVTSYWLPTNTKIDRKLVGGAALFGVGWGLAGLCPGPGIAMVGGGFAEGVLFIGSMAGGMYLFKAWQWLGSRSAAQAKPSSVNPMLAQLAPQGRAAHPE